MIADVGDIGVELPVLRSVLVKFGEALVNPPPAIMAPPDRAADHPAVNRPVCTENLIRVDDVMESPKLAE